MKNTISRIRNSVGPKPKIRLSISDGPLLGACASIVTFLLWSRLESSWLSANDGTCVAKLVEVGASLSLDGYLIACLSVPWIASPVEEISLTLPSLTCVRKFGL